MVQTMASQDQIDALNAIVVPRLADSLIPSLIVPKDAGTLAEFVRAHGTTPGQACLSYAQAIVDKVKAVSQDRMRAAGITSGIFSSPVQTLGCGSHPFDATLIDDPPLWRESLYALQSQVALCKEASRQLSIFARICAKHGPVCGRGRARISESCSSQATTSEALPVSRICEKQRMQSHQEAKPHELDIQLAWLASNPVALEGFYCGLSEASEKPD